jgi:hypothetical protein
MGRKSTGRKTPPPQAPAAGWRLLPPTDADGADPTADDEALAGVVASLEKIRAEFVKAHGRAPTEAEVIELVSLGLAEGLDDDLIDRLLIDEQITILDPFSFAEDENEDDGENQDEPAP